MDMNGGGGGGVHEWNTTLNNMVKTLKILALAVQNTNITNALGGRQSVSQHSCVNRTEIKGCKYAEIVFDTK